MRTGEFTFVVNCGGVTRVKTLSIDSALAKSLLAVGRGTVVVDIDMERTSLEPGLLSFGDMPIQPVARDEKTVLNRELLINDIINELESLEELYISYTWQAVWWLRNRAEGVKLGICEEVPLQNDVAALLAMHGVDDSMGYNWDGRNLEEFTVPEAVKRIQRESLQMRVEDIPYLSTNAKNGLKNIGLHYVWQICECGISRITRAKNFGEKSRRILRYTLRTMWLDFYMKFSQGQKDALPLP